MEASTVGTLYLLDYNGTLDRTGDPVAFLRALKKHDPDSRVVVMSGNNIPREVEAAADEFWSKPFSFNAIRDLNPASIVGGDDDAALLRALTHAARQYSIPMQVVTPGDLLFLIPE